MALIMVVDDSEFMRVRLKNLLTEEGHQVIEAGDGHQAVEMYKQYKPDLALMDITMPVMDGIAALKAIQAYDTDSKVVMCSALGQQSMVMEAIKSGAKDFIIKPYQTDKIIATVRKMVG